MSKSISQMADEIMGGSSTHATPVELAATSSQEATLPEITDEARASMLAESMGSCMMDEKLGPELKKHAKHGETSYSPASSEKDTKVDISSDDEAKLSPKAKSKLKSHRQRKGSKQDQRTSWAVDRQQPHQKAKWSQESERQKKHKASRGTPTKGAEPKPGTTDTYAGKGTPNTSTKTVAQRTASLSPSGQKTMKAASAGHQKRRNDDYQAARVKSDEEQREKWRKMAEKTRRAGGAKERKPAAAGMENSNLSQEQRLILTQARDIMREVSAVGGIGVGKMDGSSNKAYDANAKPMGKDMVPIASVDKSLSKTSKKLTPKAKKKAKKKVKTESLDLFLHRIISESQRAC